MLHTATGASTQYLSCGYVPPPLFFARLLDSREPAATARVGYASMAPADFPGRCRKRVGGVVHNGCLARTGRARFWNSPTTGTAALHVSAIDGDPLSIVRHDYFMVTTGARAGGSIISGQRRRRGARHHVVVVGAVGTDIEAAGQMVVAANGRVDNRRAGRFVACSHLDRLGYPLLSLPLTPIAQQGC